MAKSSIVLPTKKSKATKRWVDQKFLMMGMGKIGKSDFWSRGDRNLFLEFEAGLEHLDVMKVPIRNWEDFQDTAGQLYLANESGKFPYETIIVDTADKMVDRAAEYVVEQAQGFYKKVTVESVGDIPEGKGWYLMKKCVEMALDKLVMFPAAIVLISHVKTVEVTDPSGSKVNKDTISIGGQTGTSLLHWADHTLHCRAKYTGEKLYRMIRTKPTESIDAGSRGNVIEDGFEITEPMDKCYKRFRALFD